MSGTGSNLASDPNEVSIVVGTKRFSGWKSVAISRSCESMPNSFALTASTEFMRGDGLRGTRPGQACKIYIGSDLVISGWIDRRSIGADAHDHSVMISGRGLTRNMVDCSADIIGDPALQGGFIKAGSLLELAQRLAKPFGIRVRSAVLDAGPHVPGFQVSIGETPYQIIESVARWASFLVYEDVNGALVLDQVGTKSMASGFSMPGNIEAINAERSVDQRFSQYIVVWYGINQLGEFGALANQRYILQDPTLGEFRPRAMVSDAVSPSPGDTTVYDPNEPARRQARWELARRIGRSQAAQITCDSWRDSNGNLWQPNKLATIEAPDADITEANWIIGAVTFRKDMGGTHADLVLMPPDAFQPQPNPLNLFNNELVNAPRKSQDPAPPSTTPPGYTGPTLGTPPT